MVARKPVVLVTGANGEMGHGLIVALAEAGTHDVLALDVRELDPELARRCVAAKTGDILDRRLLERLVSEFEIQTIFHLAALLSTRAEFTPETAHAVNVEGTLNLLRLAVEQARWHDRPVRFLFPSSIAVYGLPDVATKHAAGRVAEDEWTAPVTMYGCNKLYCEHLGRYFARHYRQLAIREEPGGVDFRAIRFPGLISAATLPSGGTSDYAPEMIHAAAQGRAYACFVREDTRIPLMAMPDAIHAMLTLVDAPGGALTRLVYNIAAFGPSAGELAVLVRGAFPKAEIAFAPDRRRQAIVDSWPEDVDDARARRDWGFRPAYDLGRAFDDYLVPQIRRRYAAG
jgi:nucleoside-diphosphate-sugar epimerase